MSKIFELFGYPLSDRSEEAEAARRAAKCPFTETECDGGGNRYLSHHDLRKNAALREYFPGGSTVASGVCSLQLAAGTSPWIVCPRRLLVLDRPGMESLKYQDFGRELLLRHSGFSPGTTVGVWPEVKLKFTDEVRGEKKTFDYTFDYILMPLVSVELNRVEEITGMARRGLLGTLEQGGFTLASRSGVMYVEQFPHGGPMVVEIMTSSTSGGNKRNRTTIPQAFEDAILGKEHKGPGINYRQVWARMVSQLIVKSEVALGWGGSATWILQDLLVDYISRSTALDLHKFVSSVSSEVNILGLSYGEAYRRSTGVLEMKKGDLYAGPIREGGSEDGHLEFLQMVRAPVRPRLSRLVTALAKRGAPTSVLPITTRGAS